MKNYLSLLSLLISVSFLSCEKDDIATVSSSKINVYGTEIPINIGVIWESNKNVILEKVEYVWEDAYISDTGEEKKDKVVGFFRSDKTVETGNFMISLYGQGLNFIPNLATTKGEGAVICLHLASPDLKQLTSGKYKFSSGKLPNTFIGYFSSSYDMAGTSKNIATIVDGEVNVTGDGGNGYTIDVNVKLSSGVSVTCNYKGALEKGLVNQPKMAKITGIALHGLLPEIMVGSWENPDFFGGDGKVVYTPSLDEVNKAFLSISSGVTQTSIGAKESVEIAVALDYNAGEFTFISPIKARAIIAHSDKYNFPCHTIFMKAPASFKDSDYDNLETTGINISITEEVVKFPLKNFTPGYVFFDAGNGTKGVIKVKAVGSSYEFEVDQIPSIPGLIINYYDMSEQLLCDVKATTNYGNPRIR